VNYLKAAIYRFGYPLAKCYWFLARPSTQGVRCLIVNEDKILLVRHTYGSRLLNTVGGGLKKNETPREAAARETMEEVGLRLKNLQKIGEVDYYEEFKNDKIHVFLAETSDENVTLDGSEILVAGWYRLNNLPTDISPLFNTFLALARPYLQNRF
jgi:8-oxo-dGTP pyrophosphatase MutT (NUDIX family)